MGVSAETLTMCTWLEIISLAGPELPLGELKELDLEKIIYFKAFSDTFTKNIIYGPYHIDSNALLSILHERHI